MGLGYISFRHESRKLFVNTLKKIMYRKTTTQEEFKILESFCDQVSQTKKLKASIVLVDSYNGSIPKRSHIWKDKEA